MIREQKYQAGIAGLLLIAFMNFSLQSCATMRSQAPASAALKCGAGGALAGAAAGAALDSENRLRGALIGGLAGGLLGAGSCYFIASYRNQEVKGYQATKKVSGYNPSEGNVVRLTDLSLNPDTVTPGGQTVTKATYYVMTPNQNQDTPVTETWSVLKEEVIDNTPQFRPIGNFSNSITVKPGTRQSDGEIPLQSDAQEGSYLITLKVTQGALSDQKDANFTVTRDRALARAAGSKAAISAQAEHYFVASKIAAKGNVRAGPGKNYKVIGTISRGDRFPLLDKASSTGGRSGTWYKVRLDDGREAWIQESLGTVEK